MSEPTYDAYAGLLQTPEPPGLGPGPRARVKSVQMLGEATDELARRFGLPSRAADLTRALVLLWHDHLEAAHRVVQEIHNADGSFVHAIMHRREPDYWNSKYWWRKTGAHPAFERLAEEARTILDAAERRDWQHRLLPNAAWDPVAFVDVCQQTVESSADPDTALAQDLQQAEALTLLEYLCSKPPVA